MIGDKGRGLEQRRSVRPHAVHWQRLFAALVILIWIACAAGAARAASDAPNPLPERIMP